MRYGDQKWPTLNLCVQMSLLEKLEFVVRAILLWDFDENTAVLLLKCTVKRHKTSKSHTLWRKIPHFFVKVVCRVVGGYSVNPDLSVQIYETFTREASIVSRTGT